MEINALLQALQSVTEAKNILTGEDIGADFTHDEYPGESYAPDAVVRADSTETVAAVLKCCSDAGVPVTVRGAGTGQMGGSVPVKGGIVLSVKDMNQILALDEEAKTITVQPGVLLQDVKAAAAGKGLYYPPDPGEQTATIGGNVSTNAGGPCAVKYGKTKDYVLDAVLVKADGTVCKLSDDEANAAVIGSEGTLAVVTEITLRLVDKPGADAILLFPFLDFDTALNAASQILAAGEYSPAVVELLDTDIVEFSGNVTGNPVFPVEMDGERVGATLMVTLEADDDDAVMELMEVIAEGAEELECLDILVGDSPTMKRDFWAAHTAFHTSMESGAKCACEVNVDLPFDAFAEVIPFAKELGEELGLKVMLNAHVGSGGIHFHAVSDDKDAFPAAAKAFVDAMYAKVTEVGGDIVGEYGVGYGKNAYLSDEAKAAYAAVKAAFDPQGILNPGKRV